MRGADSGLWENICALPAFWVGLLYDETALAEAAALAAPLTAADVEAGRISAARDGLQGQLGSYAMHKLAGKQLLRLLRAGCSAAPKLTAKGRMRLYSWPFAANCKKRRDPGRYAAAPLSWQLGRRYYPALHTF